MEEGVCRTGSDVATKRRSTEGGEETERGSGEEDTGGHDRKGGEVCGGGTEGEEVDQVGKGDTCWISGCGDNDASNRQSDNDASYRQCSNDASSSMGDNDASNRQSNNDASRRGSNNDASNRHRDNDASSLQFLYTNAQSLVNKIEEMRAVVAIDDPDILIITETWTNDSISNDYLVINGYDIIERQDRNDTDRGRGGGIIIYVRKTLYAWKESCDTEFNQCGLIGLKTKNGEMRVLAVYRSPNSSRANDEELCRYVERMNGTYIIVGDFNFPDKVAIRMRGNKGKTISGDGP